MNIRDIDYIDAFMSPGKTHHPCSKDREYPKWWIFLQDINIFIYLKQDPSHTQP